MSKKIWIYMFISILTIAEIYFLFSFFTHGLFVMYGYTLSSLGIIRPYLIAVFLLLLAVMVSLLTIGYGLYKRKKWVIKLSYVFLVWSMIWPIWGIIYGLNLMEQIALLIIYAMLLFLISSKSFREYFSDIFRYGKYKLYSRKVHLKSGKDITIYFFSERTPKSGIPSTMPEGYKVEINKRSEMPYLKKVKE